MIVTLLTDYGHDDEFVGVCHGVIKAVDPALEILDVTHGIGRYDVRHGAVVLRNTLPYLPVGVHVAVVDPQVGTERRALALETGDGRILVGPDNGLLSLAWERAGGVIVAVDVTRSPHRLEPVSATFHGRDVFAPVAARLAAGAPLAQAGAPLDPVGLMPLELPRPRVDSAGLTATVVGIDGFGNVSLLAGPGDLGAAGLRLGRAAAVRAGDVSLQAVYARTFADVDPGDAIVYEDAARTAAVAINTGDASAALLVRPGDEVRIEPIGEPADGPADG